MIIATTCAAAAAGYLYVAWRRKRNEHGAKAPFCFDSQLPVHITLPEASVQGGVVVELSNEYRKQKMRHLVLSSAVSPIYLKALLPIIKELFVPQKVFPCSIGPCPTHSAAVHSIP